MSVEKKSLSKRIMCIILLVLCVLYILFIIGSNAGGVFAYDAAIPYTANKTVTTTGFAIRDESLIFSDKSGIAVNAVEDGTRVTYSTVVKRVFETDADARLYQSLSEINEKINYYESIYLQQRAMNIDRTTNDNNLSYTYSDILNSINERDYSSAYSKADDMGLYITSRQILTGEKIEVEDRILELKKEQSRISSSINIDEINANAVGYYCGNVDGYESTLSYNEIDSITADDINRAVSSLPNDVPQNAAGKITKGFAWYFACVVDTASIGSLSVGGNVTVRFPLSSSSELQMTVHSIRCADSENSVLILRTQTMNPETANLRIETLQIVIGEYSGIRVRSEALRVDGNGREGVYIVFGNIIKFRKVKCLYSSSEYIIVEYDAAGKDSELDYFDNVIYEGKNLYDGRLL